MVEIAPPAARSSRRHTRPPVGAPRPIAEVAASMGIGPDLLEPYGEGVAKIKLEAAGALADSLPARYVLVSAMTPTPLGEGKTTMTIGLGDGLARLGKRPVLALRQGSMGPTFGIKGGAAGGGRSIAVPVDRLCLGLTGDIDAVSAAHNLLAAMVDNSLQHGNPLDIDPHEITWRRVLDVDDRALRNVVIGLGSRADGVPRQTGFDITAASEVMAILALATSMQDMRERMGRIVVAHTRDGRPVTAEDLHAAGAMTAIMRQALKPNLVQTAEGTPVLVHAGPFGNIAHGCSSIVADLVGVRAGDVLLTEAGFAADMGAERFVNIKCRASGLAPDAGVVVATVRALKVHSGRYSVAAGRPLPSALLEENPDDVLAGAANLRAQIENIRVHGITPVVAVNAFAVDFASEHEAVRRIAHDAGVRVAVCTSHADGGEGAVELAEAVLEACDEPSDLRLLYPDSAPLVEKIATVATRVYGAAGIEVSKEAAKRLDLYARDGFADLPVCIAKTHLSLSSDAALRGAPTGWTLPVREARISAGAGFVYVIAGDMQTMPGLPTSPAAERVDVDAEGRVTGLT